MTTLTHGVRLALTVAACTLAAGLPPLQAGAQPAPEQPFAVGGLDALPLTVSHRPGREVAGPSLRGILSASDRSPVGQRLTVPTWTRTYRVNGKPFSTVMVGSDPSAGSATTTVPLVLVPLRFRFASDGQVLDDPGMAAEVAASPMIQPTSFATGTTQYADAYQRGSLWAQVSATSPDYHVLLGGPTVLATQTLDVPAADGLTAFDDAANRHYGLVQAAWFDARVQELIAQLDVDPTALVAFLAYNTYFADDPGACVTPSGCDYFTGYHGALPQSRPGDGPGSLAVNTFLVASAQDFGDLVPSRLDVSLEPFSHEVLEWLVDPLVFTSPDAAQFAAGSTAPRWTSPLYPVLCSPVLEVSDPVQGLANAIGAPAANGKVYALEDAAMFSWFARQSPSSAVGGRYDVARRLTSPSPSC